MPHTSNFTAPDMTSLNAGDSSNQRLNKGPQKGLNNGLHKGPKQYFGDNGAKHSPDMANMQFPSNPGGNYQRNNVDRMSAI